MKEYQKIETPFVRDMDGSKKLILGKFRNPLVEYLKNCQWICTEKVDGTNIRVHWDGHKFNFYGRTDVASIPTFLYTKLEEIFRNNESEQVMEQLFTDREVMLVGEGYGKKIQKCGANYIQNGVDFIGFDVMVKTKDGEKWVYLDRRDAEDIYKAFGIKMVPIVATMTLDTAVDYVMSKPKSLISEVEQEMEGLVCVPDVPVYDKSGHRIVVKIKVKDFE
jgi:hypothetical protein